jgi:hypothetical protein
LRPAPTRETERQRNFRSDEKVAELLGNEAMLFTHFPDPILIAKQQVAVEAA